MDKKALVGSLNKCFCKTNKKERRYMEAWLSDVDSGGMYNGKFVLNVKTMHQIEDCIKNIFAIINIQ